MLTEGELRRFCGMQPGAESAGSSAMFRSEIGMTIGGSFAQAIFRKNVVHASCFRTS